MQNTQNVSQAKPKVGGAVYYAPIGSTLSTDATTALDVAFKSLGYISAVSYTHLTLPTNREV